MPQIGTTGRILLYRKSLCPACHIPWRLVVLWRRLFRPCLPFLPPLSPRPHNCYCWHPPPFLVAGDSPSKLTPVFRFLSVILKMWWWFFSLIQHIIQSSELIILKWLLYPTFAPMRWHSGCSNKVFALAKYLLNFKDRKSYRHCRTIYSL